MDDSEVQVRAAEAVCLSKGLSAKLFEDVSDRCERDGFDKMPLPLQHYMAVWQWYLECSNGGPSQYFINPAGDHAIEALAGAKAMGATIDAYELEKKMALFGSEGPPRDWAKRRALIYQNDKLFEALDADADLPKHLTQLDTIAMAELYAAKNAEVFRQMK
jgi:hypothetical protein